LATKLKNNRNSNIKAVGFVIFAIILFCLGTIWLVDQGLNGVLKEWIYNKFYISYDYPNHGKLGVIFKSWPEIKQIIMNVFFAFVIILALCTGIVAHFYACYQSKKDIYFITGAMSSFIKSDSDDITLPIKYAEIETMLIRIKATSQKHQQLVQTEMQRKNDLITYLAHDLKTPLASVIGYLSLLDEAPDMPVEQKAKYVGIALQKAYRLEELINEFFDITRFNLQSIVLNKSKIKLAFMLQQMVEEFYPMLTPRENRQPFIFPRI